MTKNEFKNLKYLISKKDKEIDTEIKALQRAIDQRMGDTARVKQKHTELKGLHNEIGKASH